MKILHIISSGGMYGAEAVILDLSRCLRRSGHESALGIFANSAQPNTELEQRARADGLETHAIPCRGQLDPSVPGRIRDLVQTTGADVVHAHGYKADIYAYYALRGATTPLVSTCHNWLDNNLSLRLYGSLDRRALRRYRRVIAVSEGVEQRLLASGVRRDHVVLIRNGVDLRPFAAIDRSASPSSQPTVGIVARLSPEKGVDLFLRAASLVLNKLPGARFLVAGDGPERSALQSLLEELNLSGRVHLIGRQEDMPAFYGSLDLLVLSSRIEGLPMALLEGMASGLPIVATSVGEVPQVIESGKTGLVVPAGDYTALAAAILDLLQNPAQLRLMGEAARARVAAEFSADRMTAEYLHTYQQVLGESPS